MPQEPLDLSKLSDEQLEAYRSLILKQQQQAVGEGSKQQKTFSDSAMDIGKSALNVGKDFLAGIGSGVVKTGTGIYSLAGNAQNALARGVYGSAVPEPPPIPETVKKWAEPPPSLAGRAGQTVEQIGEYFIPQAAGMKAAKAGILARAGVEAAGAGMVGAAQTGTPQGAIIPAVTSGAMSALSPLFGRMFSGVKGRLTPVMKEALDWAEQHGVPLTGGQKTGNQALETTEKGLESTFGSSGRATEFFKGQQDALQSAGRDLVNRSQPGRSLNPYEAGQNLESRVRGIIGQAKSNADAAYDALRTEYAKHTKSVQTGTKASSILDAAGNPIQVPVMKTLELPTDVSASQQALKPIFEELSKTMPEAQRAASPGYTALRNFLEGPSIVDAVTADRNLGAIKAIVRTGNNPYLTSQSQGIAKATVRKLEQDFNKSLATADPSLVGQLQTARESVRKQHTVAEMLNSLPKEPAQLYDRLVRAGDKTYNDLAFLNTIAPQEMRQVGRTFLDGLFEKATAEGGFGRSAGVLRDWQRLGPNTKKLLFGQAAVKELDQFFLASKALTRDVNPSKSGKLLINSLGLAGAMLDASRHEGSLEEKAKRFGIDLATMAGGSNLLSRLLLTPGGSRFLINGISSSVGQGTRAIATGIASQAIPPPPQQ